MDSHYLRSPLKHVAEKRQGLACIIYGKGITESNNHKN